MLLISKTELNQEIVESFASSIGNELLEFHSGRLNMEKEFVHFARYKGVTETIIRNVMFGSIPVKVVPWTEDKLLAKVACLAGLSTDFVPHHMLDILFNQVVLSEDQRNTLKDAAREFQNTGKILLER